MGEAKEREGGRSSLCISLERREEAEEEDEGKWRGKAGEEEGRAKEAN